MVAEQRERRVFILRNLTAIIIAGLKKKKKIEKSESFSQTTFVRYINEFWFFIAPGAVSEKKKMMNERRAALHMKLGISLLDFVIEGNFQD